MVVIDCAWVVSALAAYVCLCEWVRTRMCVCTCACVCVCAVVIKNSYPKNVSCFASSLGVEVYRHVNTAIADKICGGATLFTGRANASYF